MGRWGNGEICKTLQRHQPRMNDWRALTPFERLESLSGRSNSISLLRVRSVARFFLFFWAICCCIVFGRSVSVRSRGPSNSISPLRVRSVVRFFLLVCVVFCCMVLVQKGVLLEWATEACFDCLVRTNIFQSLQLD
jgi:hypothetical protein